MRIFDIGMDVQRSSEYLTGGVIATPDCLRK
jgi:hypothetical protein